MTKLRIGALVIFVIAAVVWYACRGPSTAEKDQAIGGRLRRDHMSIFTGWTVAHLIGARITDDKLPDIDLESLSTVKVVNLTNTAITSDGLAAVGRWTQIKQLNLANNPGIDDRGRPLLAPLKVLMSLPLVGTSVGDDGKCQLADLPSLTDLGLNGTRVGDDGMDEMDSNFGAAESDPAGRGGCARFAPTLTTPIFTSGPGHIFGLATVSLRRYIFVPWAM